MTSLTMAWLHVPAQSHTGNHALCAVLCLAPFPPHYDVRLTHVTVCGSDAFIFHHSTLFPCVKTAQFTQSTVDRHLDGLQFLLMKSKVATSIFAQAF